MGRWENHVQGSGVTETFAALVEKLRELVVRRLQEFKQDCVTASTPNELHVCLLVSFAHCISFVTSLWATLWAGIPLGTATRYGLDCPGIESR
jgi:hypothetical protein